MPSKRDSEVSAPQPAGDGLTNLDPGKGRLFRRVRPKTNPRAGDWFGSALYVAPDGTEHKLHIVGWNNTSRRGTAYIGLSVEDWETSQTNLRVKQAAEKEEKPSYPNYPEDDSIPF